MSSVKTIDFAVPAADGNSDEVDISAAKQLTLYLSGTFVANIQWQISPFASGSTWFDEGAAQSAPGSIEVTRLAKRARAVVSGYVSGTPIGTACFG